MHGRHQNKERSLSADPDTQSDRREMELKILWHILQGDNQIFGVKKGNPGCFGKSVIFEFERTGGCKAFIQGSDQGKEAVRDSLPSFRRRRGGQGTDRCGTPVCQSVCKKSIYILKSKVIAKM